MNKKNRRAKFRVLRRAVHRYLQSRDLHKSIKEMEQDIKSVDGAIAQLEAKRDNLKDFYGVGYKITRAKLQGLYPLEEQLQDRLVMKKEQCIPLSLLREIIYEDGIKTEGTMINIIKTYLNFEAGEDTRVDCKDAVSLELSHNGMSHREADEQSSIIVNSILDRDSNILINTRKSKKPVFKKATHGGYLRNQPRPKKTEEEDN